MAKNTEAILKKLPKNAPTWSVGIVSIIVAITSAFIAIYALTQTQIKDYVQNQHEIATTKAKADDTVTQAMLALITRNSEQITSLTDSLQITAKQNMSLNERITELEKRVAETTLKLADCSALLEQYKLASKTSVKSNEPMIEPANKG